MSPEGGHSHEEQSNVQQSDRARRRKSESGRGSLDDAELSRLLTDWVGERFPDDHDGVRRTFIDVEFRQRLRSYRKSARSWRAAQILLWLVVAVWVARLDTCWLQNRARLHDCRWGARRAADHPHERIASLSGG